MSIVDYLKRNPEDEDLLQGLESDMSDALEQEFAAGVDSEALPPREIPRESVPGMTAEDGEQIAPASPVISATEGQDRLTSNSKKFLSGFDTFEAQYLESQADLKEISEKISRLAVSQHLTRDFLNMMQASIYHGNEVELSNKDLHGKNRALNNELENAKSLVIKLKQHADELQRREARLQQEKDSLRTALTTANDELSELRTEVAANDAELTDLRRDLAAKTSLADKMSRDNELVREKHVNLSVDLDSAMKAASEMRRKNDEMSTNLKSTSAELSETTEQLAEAQKEMARLGRELEMQTSKLSETTDALRVIEFERDEADGQHKAEIQAIRTEFTNLESRFQATSREQENATEEVIAIKLKLSDAVSEKRVAEEKAVSLAREIEEERRLHAETSTKVSEVNLERASERVVFETAQQQLQEQRSEVSRLQSEVKRLLAFERLYRAKKDELKCDVDLEDELKSTQASPDVGSPAVASAAPAVADPMQAETAEPKKQAAPAADKATKTTAARKSKSTSKPRNAE